MKTRIGLDFLVLCPLDLEVHALTNALADIGHVDNNVVELSTYLIPRANGVPARVLIYQLPDQGNLFSGIAAVQALRAVANCRYIVSFGLAGTIDRDTLQIGDVLVAREVVYYELWREQKDPAAERARLFTCSRPEHALATIQRSFQRDAETFSLVANRSLASGEKLFDKPDSELVTRIRRMNEQLSAVEMEAAGVAAATKEVSPETHFFAVKGISDNADGSKKDGPSRERENNRKRAAGNAGRVLAKLIDEVVRAPDFECASSASVYRLDGPGGTAQSRRFAEVIKDIPWIVGPVNSFALAKAHIFSEKLRPPIFYHWRQESVDTHLVDLLFVCVLAHLNGGGYPIHLLITDSEEMSSDDRRRLESMLTSWSYARVSFYTETLSRERKESEMHADDTSIIRFFSDRVDNLIGADRYNLPSNTHTSVRFWLSYVPFISRHHYGSPAAILLCWQRHLSIYHEVLDCHLDFYPALLNTPDLELNGTPLKFGSQTKDLMVRQGDLSKFVSCVNSIHEPESLGSLLELLSKAESLEIGDRLGEFLGRLSEHVQSAMRYQPR